MLLFTINSSAVDEEETCPKNNIKENIDETVSRFKIYFENESIKRHRYILFLGNIRQLQNYPPGAPLTERVGEVLDTHAN